MWKTPPVHLALASGDFSGRLLCPWRGREFAAGTVLALARSLGEFGATLMLAGNIPGKTATIPVAIYFAIQQGNTNEALILSGIVVVIAFASLFAIAYWKGRTSITRTILQEREGLD